MDAIDKELEAEYARVLKPSFWDHRSQWPRGGRAHVFLGEAIEEVGRTKFGEKWRGDELQACDFTPDFVSFERYLEILAATDSFDHQAAWLQRRDDWASIKADRQASYDRLLWCINWIGDAASSGALATVLRVVDTGRVGSAFYAASESLWNVEPLVDRRFHFGHFEWCLPVPSDDLTPVFAFFTRESLDRALASVEGTPSPTLYADLSTLSPRLKLAVDFSIGLNIDAKWKSPKLSVLTHMIEEAWEKEHGTKLSPSSAVDIARLIKHSK